MTRITIVAFEAEKEKKKADHNPQPSGSNVDRGPLCGEDGRGRLSPLEIRYAISFQGPDLNCFFPSEYGVRSTSMAYLNRKSTSL